VATLVQHKSVRFKEQPDTKDKRYGVQTTVHLVSSDPTKLIVFGARGKTLV